MESKICLIASIAIFAVVIGQVQGYTAIIMPQHDPLNTDMCFDPENGYRYARNTENARPGFCERIYCWRDLSMVIHGCGVVEAGEGCEVVTGDLSKPYPFCCDQVKCTAPLDGGVWEDNYI